MATKVLRLVITLGLLMLSVPGTAAARTGKTGPSANCRNTSVGLTPLNDLGSAFYNNYQGGLYPNASNVPPADYLATGLAQASRIQPLDRNGAPSPAGKIVLLSVGMSNTSYEYEGFVSLAQSDRTKAPVVQVVNGAISSYTADEIINTRDRYWSLLAQKVQRAGMTAAQVQVIWLKQGIDYNQVPAAAFPADATTLKNDLAIIVGTLEKTYPNLRIVYVSGRTYGGYASTSLNPDGPPYGISYYAYDSGFAVKWLIQDRIEGITHGTSWLAWGPYLWADGIHPRSDGLTWVCADFRPTDGTHPSYDRGVPKVAELLLNFFHADPTASSWYLAH